MAVDPIRAAGDPLTRVAGAQTHALFEHHARMVYGLCRALLRDPDDADDATQATFISAYRSLLGGIDVREPAAWLATIARNECAARAQARMREPLPLFEADLGSSPGPEAELDRRELVSGLQQAVAGLPEKQREAVVLRDLYGLRYTEVGAALGMSVASVESLLFRARRSLRVSLKPLLGGALTVPVAVREGIAQALPSFTTARAAGGGAASGAVGLGLLAKLTGGPAAVKAVTGFAAVITAGSVAVVGVERAEQQRPAHVEQAAQLQAQPAGAGDPRGTFGAAVASFGSSREGGSHDDDPSGGRSGGDGHEGSGGTGSASRSDDNDADAVGARTDEGDDDDAGGADRVDGRDEPSGSAGSRDDGDSENSGSREVMAVATSHSGSGSNGDEDEAKDSEDQGSSENEAEEHEGQDEPDELDEDGEDDRGSEHELGDDPAPAPA